MLLLLASLAHADDIVVDMDAQVRPRLEADSVRGVPPGEGPAMFISQRSRLGFRVESSGLTLRLMANDVRTLGEETDTRRDYSADGLDMREAYLAWSKRRFTLSVGRFERGLYNERLLAMANWRQAGRSFDGGILEVDLTPSLALEARGYVLREGTPQVAASDQAQLVGKDRALSLLTLRWEQGPLLLAPMVFVDGDGDVERLRTTSGAYSKVSGEAWTLEVEGYLQTGREGEQSLLSGLGAARLDWHPESVGLGLSYDLISADADPNDDRDTSFNTLFGANHRYYGNIDLAMYYVGGSADDRGLQDAQLRASWQPNYRVSLGADLHALLTTLAVEDRLLAVEPDLYFKVGLRQGLTLSGGGNLWIAPEPDDREWMGWLMLDAKLGTRIADSVNGA